MYANSIKHWQTYIMQGGHPTGDQALEQAMREYANRVREPSVYLDALDLILFAENQDVAARLLPTVHA